MSNPYTAPTADFSHAGESDDVYDPEMFSFKGRIGRCRYLAYSIGMTLILMVVAGIVGALAGSLIRNPVVIGVIWYVPGTVIMLTMAVRRLNDMHRAGWWSLLMLIPVVNLFAGLWLMFGPGDEQANEYGPAPSPNTWPVIVGACAMPVFMVAIIGILAAVAIPAYQTYVQRAHAAQQGQPPVQAPQPQ